MRGGEAEGNAQRGVRCVAADVGDRAGDDRVDGELGFGGEWRAGIGEREDGVVVGG